MKRKNKYDRVGSSQDFSTHEGYHARDESFEPDDRAGLRPSSETRGWEGQQYSSRRQSGSDYGTASTSRFQTPPDVGSGFSRSDSMYDYGPHSSIRSMGNAYWQDPKPEHGPHFGKGPKGYQRSDDRIKEDVSEALRVHSEIDATEIEVEVHSGIVSLSGTVDSRKTKRMVEDEIEMIAGVDDVKNDLRILASIEGPQPGWGKEMPSRPTMPAKAKSQASNRPSNSR